MTVKKGNKKIEFELNEELANKWNEIAKLLGFSRKKFIKNAVDMYIINLFETIKPICENNDNINKNLKNYVFPTMICPVCEKEIDKRGSKQHIDACKKNNNKEKQHNPKIISKEKRDRLKKEKKFESIGRDGRMIEQL